MHLARRLGGTLAGLAVLASVAALGMTAGTGTSAPIAYDPGAGMVQVPGGMYAIGLTEDQMMAAVAECAAATSEQLCFAYSTTLSLMGTREVAVSSFWIDRAEVSRGEYRRCVMAGKCASKPLWIGVPPTWGDAHPITYVSWFDAKAYCEARGMRLPTEAEWEVAARGSRQSLWPWGDKAHAARFNHGAVLRGTLAFVLGEARDSLRITSLPDGKDGYMDLAPRGRYPLGMGPFGTLDQAGNAAEWTADSWNERGYEGMPLLNPHRDDGIGGKRVIRGGSWLQPAYLGQSNLRDPHNMLEIYDAAEARPDVGFRCARGMSGGMGLLR